MPKLLIVEGNTAAHRQRGAANGLRASGTIYAEAIAAHFPDLELTIINAADPEGAADNARLADYDGLVVGGSALHAYDSGYAVENQIALVAQAGALGLPVLGSCWGLQVAAMAGGGRVAANPQGREVGMARKIALTAAAMDHPMYRGKPPVFDAVCIHYDEVERLPDGSEVLASNRYSRVQAAVVRVGRSRIWAVQYHPEFDLPHLAALYRHYAADMRAQGFFADDAALESHADRLERLAASGDEGLAWQLGIDADVLDEQQRRREIINWVENCIL